MLVSANTLNCPKIFLRAPRSAQQSLSGRKRANPKRSTINPLARPRWHSSGNINAVGWHGAKKRLHEIRSVEDVGREPLRQSERSTSQRADAQQSPKKLSASGLQ